MKWFYISHIYATYMQHPRVGSRPRSELTQIWTTKEIKQILKEEKAKGGGSMLQIQERIYKFYLDNK